MQLKFLPHRRGSLLLSASIIFFLLCVHSARGQMRQVFHDNLDPDNEIRKTSFYSATEGYVAFAKWIGYTTDSGRTFERRYITTGNVDYNGYSVGLTFGFNINGVKAFSRDTIIVYGNYAFVPSMLYSTNGGASYTLIYHTYFATDHFTDGITDMVFPENGSIGYAVEFDRILKTFDRGRTWGSFHSDPDSYFDFIEAVNSNTAFAFSVLNKIKLVKITGGNTSVNVPLPSGQLRYISFISENVGWANIGPDIFYTSDGGGNWSKKNLIPCHFNKMRFINDSMGFGTSGGYVFKTTDSGKVWERIPNLPGNNAFDYSYSELEFFTKDHFWAGGSSGLLSLTTNGGGLTIPTAAFGTDTTGLFNTKLVKLINYSKSGYSYAWFKNDTLISRSYHITYTRNSYPLEDTIKLIVSNGTYNDTLVSYLKFHPPVVITSFTPTTVAAGVTVTIHGDNFIDATAVFFGGTPAASFSIVSNNLINAVVGEGSSGNVTVITAARGEDSKPGFTYVPPPAISSFDPVSAKAGSIVTISGNNFENASEVRFGGVAAISFTVVNSNTIKATVPSGISGPVFVKTPGGTDQRSGFVAMPDIISFTPDSGTLGSVMTIAGTSLTEVTSVSMGGVPVSSFNINSANELTAVVAAGASGDVIVQSPGGSDTLKTFIFIPKPVIAAISPTSGPVGTLVTVTGKFFDPVPANNIVYFGGVKAVVSSASSTSLSVTVPPGTTLQPISVTVNNRTGYSRQVFNITFTSGGYLTPNSFTKNEWNAGSGRIHQDVETGDFDGDGKIDLLVITYAGAGGNVSLLRNNSTGGTLSFESPVDYAIQAPKKLAVGDVEGDGQLDFVVTDTVNNTFSCYRNTSTPGNISFASPMVIPTLSNPVDAAITDVDGDGKTDIIISASGITIYRNYSNQAAPVFDSTILVEGGNDMLIKDVDGDGRQDIVSTNYAYNYLSIMSNNSTPGKISFGIALGRFIYSERLILPAINDMNNDGKPDVIAFDNEYRQLMSFRNSSTPGFFEYAPPVIFGSGLFARSIALSDLDGDGKPDLLVSHPDYNFSMHRNISPDGSNLNFELPVRVSPGTYTGNPDIDIADLDGDGKPDPIVVNENGSLINIYINKGIPKPYIISFTPNSGSAGTEVEINGRYFSDVSTVSFGAVPAASFTIVSDTSIKAIVGTGATGNIVITNSFGTDSLGVFVFGSAPIITSFSPASGPVGSTLTITGSGFSTNSANNIVRIGGIKATVIAATSTSLTVTVPTGQAPENISVTVNDLTAYSTKPFIVTFPGNTSGFGQNSFTRALELQSAMRGSVADINDDGKADLVLLGNNAHSFSVAVNTSSPGIISFAPAIDIQPGNNSLKSVVADIDGDGKLDIAVLDAVANSFGVLRNTSSVASISFDSKIDYTIGTEPSAGNDIAIADLNGDGRPDIVACNFDSHVIRVFKNLSTAGKIQFEFDSEHIVAGQPLNITIGDVDGDSKPDVVVGVFYISGRKGVFRNISTNAAIAFEPFFDVSASDHPTTIIITDLNNNARSELITTHRYGTTTISFQEYNGSPGNLSFDFNYSISTDIEPTSVVSGDLDGDGKPDIVISRSNSQYISFVKNTSAGGLISLEDTTNFEFPSSPYPSLLGDLDMDGALDIIGFSGHWAFILQNQHGNVQTVQVCPGSDTSFNVPISGQGYQWQQNIGSGFTNISNNNNISGANSATLKLTDIPASWNGYQFRCIVGDVQAGRNFILSLNGVSVNPGVDLKASDTEICAGTSVILTAIPENGGANPTYQWFLNGNDVGNDSSQYSPALQAGIAAVRVIMTSSEACASSPADTAEIQIVVNPSVRPAVSISSSTDTICIGNIVTFTASPVNEGTNPVYQWKKNGVNVGTNNPVYNDNTMMPGDTVTVMLTSSATCASPATVTSNAMRVVIEPNLAPVVTISGDTVVDANASVSLAASATNFGGSLVYEWQDSTGTHGWQDITGASGPTLSYSPVAGAKVRVLVTGSKCGSLVTVGSRAISFISNSGGRIVPNPVTTFLYIEGLKLSDKWEILEVADLATGRIVMTENIVNKTTVMLYTSNLSRGNYVAILKRSSGPWSYLRFVK